MELHSGYRATHVLIIFQLDIDMRAVCEGEEPRSGHETTYAPVRTDRCTDKLQIDQASVGLAHARPISRLV